MKDILTDFKEMKTFLVIWIGQLVSVVGSGLTRFAIGLWIYQRTGSVTQFALIALCTILPHLLLAPFAGVVVDRWDRRKIMIFSDIGAGLGTLLIAVLFFHDSLALWQIYLITAISAAFDTFQWPAYAASITLLVPKKQLGRANGMVQFGQAASEILAPLFAGVLIVTIQMWGVLLIDVLTFLFAVGTLLFVRFPEVQKTTAENAEKGQVLHDALYGWKYIKTRPGLLGLLLFFAVVNFLWGTVGALIYPMVLNFSSADVLGLVITIAGAGMLTGSIIMSIWGGPKRQINGVINFEMFSGFCFLLIGLRPFAALVALGAFCAHLTIAIVSGSDQAIWQRKVPSDVQGRVFAIRHMISTSTRPLAYLLAGPLADRVFEPMMAVNGRLAESIGPILGTGPGRGIALLFVIMGFIKIAVSLGAYLAPHVRYVEDELPDAITEDPAVMAT